MLDPIEIFRPGRHTAMSGDTIEFSAADLRAAAQAYDPQKWRAPIVVGHPKIDAPAYGWIDALEFAEQSLNATPADVDPAFAQLVREGRYRHVSASFYLPSSAANPAPGSYYLRHVGFLGAQPPALRGLKPVQFAAPETDAVTIEFAAAPGWSVARIMRSLRDWFIGKEGLEAADQVIPAYAVEEIEAAAHAPEDNPGMMRQPAFAAAPVPPTDGDVMSDADRARLAELETENQRLRQESEQRLAAARHEANAAFAQSLVNAGRLPPGHRAAVVGCMDLIAAHTEAVAFAEGAAPQSPIEAFRAFLSALPVQLQTGEFAAAGGQPDAAAAFAAPAGYQVDAEALALHGRALTWQKTHPNTDYLAAVAAVQGA